MKFVFLDRSPNNLAEELRIKSFINATVRFLLIHLFSESWTVNMFCVTSDPEIWWEYRGRLREGHRAKSESLIVRCGRLDEPIRHDMTDQFTSSAMNHGIISRPQFRYLPIFSAEFTRVSSNGGASRGEWRYIIGDDCRLTSPFMALLIHRW